MKKIIAWLVSIFLLASCTTTNDTQENSQEINTQQKTILALWDSITAGYNLDISQAYPAQLEKLLQDKGYNYKIINAWVSWDTSQNLLDRIDLYADTQADIYLLTIGGNDALRRMDLQNLKQNIQEIIDTIYSQNPEAQIVLSGMQIPINYGLSYANNFKKLYSEIAEENNLEFYEFFLQDVAQKSDLNLSDGIHPNEKWYAIIAQNLFDFLKTEKIISQ